jgi:hypothetical protein
VSSPASGALRSLRAALLGAACVGLALTGHVVGGGRAPSLWALVILAIPMGGGSLALTSRRRGLPVIGLTVAGSQLLLHQALMWSSAGCAVTGDLQAHLGHAATAPVLDCASMPGMGSTAGPTHFSTLAMLLGHALAAAVTTMVLAYGESLVWGVWRRIVRRPAVAARPSASVGRLVIGYGRSVPRPRTPGGLTRRRGPPAFAPVAV